MSSDTTPHPDAALRRLFYHTERIRFVYWQQFSGAKPTVILIGLMSVVVFITGLSNLSQPTIPLDGPLAQFIPVPESLVRFYGVFVAFLLAGSAFGLNRRKYVAWYLAMVLVPLVAVLPLVTFQVNDILVLLLALVTFPLLVMNRHQFNQSLDLSPVQISSMAAIVGVLSYATVGSYVMRENYVGIETWVDAIYYVIVTIATVGYGDATPLTQETKLFTLSFILLGTGAFTVAIGSLLIPAIESRMAAAVGHMTPSDIRLLEDHVLILGYSELTEPIIDSLDEEVDIVVITNDADEAADLRKLDVNVVTADPTEKDTLRETNIDSARGVVVAGGDDAQDVMAILAVKQTNPDVYVVTAANDVQHIDKLQDVGADEVISPTVIGGQLIGEAVLGDRWEMSEK